jgi:hypothetical protein
MISNKLAHVALLALFVLPLAACGDGLLTVDDPDIITPENLISEAGLQALRNGALGNFVYAYVGGGSDDGQVMASGLMTDEWMHSGTFPTRQEVELRVIPWDNGTMQDVFLRLQHARADLEDAAEQLAEGIYQEANTDERVPEMQAYAGYTYLAFGENYCSGVPYSDLGPDGELVFGAPQTTAETFNAAVGFFDAAIAHPAVEDDILNTARVGKGRALLSLNDYAGAATAVASVPDDFVKFTEHSNNSGRERNGIYELNYTVRRWSVGNNEGQNGLDFRDANDPRIVWAFDDRGGFDGSSELYIFDNLLGRGDPMPLASGVEARLIEAEAALATGGNWLTILNDLRADWGTIAGVLYPNAGLGGTLAALTDPGTPAAREDLLFRERAFWLYSTGHRLGDMRRLIRQYGRGAESVFPTGAYFKAGSTYGTAVNFPIPEDEGNNPNWSQCIDRNP